MGWGIEIQSTRAADVEFPLRLGGGNLATPAFLAQSSVGAYDNAGTLNPIGSYNATAMIAIQPGQRLYVVADVASPPTVAGSFYTADLTYISGGVSANGFSIAAPATAAFVRVNYDNSKTPAIFVVDPTQGTSAAVHKIYFAGDSTTYGLGSTSGNTYPDAFGRRLGFPAAIVNGGISDSTLTVLAGHNPFSQRILTGVVPIDTELLIIKYGVNDYRYGAPLGALGDTTDATFYGAMVVVMEYMKAYRKATRVVWTKPAWTTDVVTPVSALPLFWQAIDEVADLYKVTVLDDNKSGIPLIGEQTTPYGGNGTTILHPNDYGYKLLGEYAAMALDRR